MSGSKNGLVSQEKDQQSSSEIKELVLAIREQTKAINNLAVSNQQVIALLTDVVASMEGEDSELGDVGYFLDGTPINGR